MSLLPLAQEICRRYREQFPDEQARYGDAGSAWCVHDAQYLLSWGAGEVQGYMVMNTQVDWLAGILIARDLPIERLARALDIAAGVVAESVDGEHGHRLRTVLDAAAAYIPAQHGST